MAGANEEPGLADLKIETITQDQFEAGRRKAPRTSAATSSAKRKTPLPAWKDGVISSFMEGIYTTCGDLIEPYDEPWGITFKASAAQCGEAWEAVAKDNTTVRRWIHGLMTTSKLSQLFMAHLPFLLMGYHRYGPLREKRDDIAAEFDAAASSSGPWSGGNAA
jgi:hypothetical protein